MDNELECLPHLKAQRTLSCNPFLLGFQIVPSLCFFLLSLIPLLLVRLHYLILILVQSPQRIPRHPPCDVSDNKGKIISFSRVQL